MFGTREPVDLPALLQNELLTTPEEDALTFKPERRTMTTPGLARGIGVALLLVHLVLAFPHTAGATRIHAESVEYKDRATVLEGYLAYDDAVKGRRPGVIIVHEWWGLGEHPKESAERLAELGYVAFALDMYGKGKLTDSAEQAAKWSGVFRRDPELARSKFEAALEVLRGHDRTDPARVAAIGYCFGGTICLEMARMGLDLDGVVSFHGGLKSGLTKAQREPIKARVLVCHGADDSFVPPEQVMAFEQEMREAGVDWQLIAYGGAVHSFTNPAADKHGIDGVKYNAKADRRSWEAMKLFLKEIFDKSAEALPSLQTRLDARKKAFLKSAPAELVAVFQDGVDELADSGIVERAVNVGDKAPNFKLPNAAGETVSLAGMLEHGPVVVVWYRGGWCVYCNIQLPALQEVVGEIRRHGATMVAISPETPNNARDTTRKNKLDFQILSDAGNKVARKYGIAYTLPSDVATLFKGRIDLEKYNGDTSNELPLAVTYVIGTDGVVRYAFVDADYRKRAEPADIIEALKKLGKEPGPPG